MTRLTLYFGLLLLISTGLFGCGQPGSEGNAIPNATPTLQAVLNTVEAYDDAWSRKDTAAVSDILADGYLYFSSRGGIRSRNWILNDLLGNPTYRIDSLSRSDIAVKLYRNVAIVGSRWQGFGSYGDSVIEDNQRCSQTFTLIGGELYLAAEHCTDIEQ